MSDPFRFPNARLIIFAKAPVAGECNTRLAESIGDQAAADLQHELIENRLAETCAASLCPVELWCAPDSTHSVFQSLATRYPISLLEQSGEDLGQRMYHAMTTPVAEFSIIIGTDCPVLSKNYLFNAYQALEKGSDVVIGPAEDGGYVLLGLRHIHRTLFSDISWGSSAVYAETIRAIEALSLSCISLETLWDLDRPADYDRYRGETQSRQPHNINTNQ